MKRRNLLSLAVAVAASVTLPSLAKSSLPLVEVYKNPDCGCCGAWVDHLKASGFDVKVHETPDTAPVRKRYGIPDALGSCHTAVVAGYAIEGHVPAADVKRLLSLKPAAAGLSVPGMPVGSPGMEVGSRKDAFDVLLVDKAGRTRVFSSYAKS
ncbi:MAG: DUF411 domain-containing protein [Pseudomonadota bacterium]